MQSDLIHIEVINYEKHNIRQDRSNHSWLKFRNDFFTDPKLFNLSLNNKALFIYLLCESSKQGKKDIVISRRLVNFTFSTSDKELNSYINNLVEIEIIATKVESYGGLEKRREEKSAVASGHQEEPLTGGEDLSPNDGEEKPMPKHLLDLWNDLKHDSLPSAIGLSTTRAKAASARLKEYPDVEVWEKAIQALNKSDFHLGRVPPRPGQKKPWKANFDWFIKPNSILQLLEMAQ